MGENYNIGSGTVLNNIEIAKKQYPNYDIVIVSDPRTKSFNIPSNLAVNWAPH